MSEKYYTSSDGSKTLLKDLESTHLFNGYAKKIRDIFSSTNKNEYYNKLTEIEDIKEEVYKRLNDFVETLESNDVNDK